MNSDLTPECDGEMFDLLPSDIEPSVDDILAADPEYLQYILAMQEEALEFQMKYDASREF